MLTKFETKSNRVKGLTFHPRRPWVLCSLHNGIVQLWDYRMGTLLDRFDEHDGPVRGIHFHVSQPLFVSGGDDYKLKVWNYKLRRCMFTLLGHLDYVRTVQFHNENPWIVSASDDQTIRVWNWISRSCITVLTGHNHYVMCASFHPKDDLIVSASLDQTVRVWDIAGLKRKSSGPSGPGGGIGGGSGGGAGQQGDLFGGGDAVVKYVLEGHDRGVNWASFHHSLPLIVSGADDRQVKLWRMNDTKAWEVDTLRGHMNNVSCVLFHPRKELILSNSEDKSIRVWDMSKRTAVATFRREHDRFWIMAAHPHQNLLAAGHDSGMIVYKLERERPALISHADAVYYVKEKNVRCHTFGSGNDVPLVQLRRRDTAAPPPRSISYNHSDGSVIVCSDNDGGTYELYGTGKDQANSDGFRGQGLSAVFVARNRFAVLDRTHKILVKDMRNEVSKTVDPPHASADMLFPATPGCCLIRSEEKITLFDVQQRKVLGELSTPLVKLVVWSEDMSRVALLSKHAIIVATRKLAHICTVHETIRIKSGAWDASGIFVYTTLNHIKFCLPNGDNGIIKTLEQPIYMAKIAKNTVTCIDREGMVRTLNIDATEMIFKLKLVQRKYGEVLSMIRTAKLCGQAIIGYLQQKGFPEIALHFVQDDKVKFGLAIESGNIEVAEQCAWRIDEEDAYQQLANVALKLGNIEVVEKCYFKTKNFERLSFLYLITGQTDKLRKMFRIAESRNDTEGSFNNALYLGDVGERVNILKGAGQDTLALLAASNHGLDEVATEIAEHLDVEVPDMLNPDAELLAPPLPILVHGNWPQLEAPSGFFGGSSLDPGAGASVLGELDDDDEGGGDGWPDDDEDGGIGGDLGDDLGLGDEIGGDDEDGGWDMDGDDMDLGDIGGGGADGGTSGDYYVSPTPGESVADLWAKTSDHPAEHVAAGSFESAMGLLRDQLGITNFEPLKDTFLNVYAACRAQLPSLPSLAPLPISLVDPRTDARPVLYLSLPGLVQQLKSGYLLFQKGKFADSQVKFSRVLQQIPLLLVPERQALPQVKELISQCREYITAVRLELARREHKADPAKAAELAALMTHCKLQAPHLMLTLRSAMMLLANKNVNNFQHAASMCKRLLELNPKPDLAQKARGVLQVCDRNPRNNTKIDYDDRNPFSICAISLKPIYRGNTAEKCNVCESCFMPAHKGSLCPTCELGSIGAPASGMKYVRIP